MHSKVVLVVSRTHWRCLSCKLLNKRMVSIDQHLQSAHPKVGLPSTSTSSDHPVPHSSQGFPTVCQQKGYPKYELPALLSDAHSLSDGELDTALKIVGFSRRKSVSEVKQELESGKKSQVHRTQIAAPTNTLILNSKKRQNMKSMALVAAKTRSQKTGGDSEVNSRTIPENTNALDNELVVENESGEVEMESGEVEMSAGRCEKSKESKLAAKDAVSHAKLRQKGKQKSSRRQNTSEKDTLTPWDPHEQSDGCVTKETAVDGRKRKKGAEHSGKANNVDITGQSGTVVKEEHNEGHSEREANVNTCPPKNTAVKKKRPRKACNPDAANKSKMINKSNIATSCVPWLLDSHRKAGEKVTKKSRRTLLPEEKQAVRELYGISHFKQTVHTSSTGMPTETDQHYAVAQQSMNVSESFCTPHSSLLPPAQRLTQEQDVITSHRNYLLNIFSPGTRDFFQENSRTQESMYPGYAGMFPQQQQQHPSYALQTSAAYPVLDAPTQRSNMLSHQQYSQSVSAVLPSHNDEQVPRHQMEMDTFTGQGFSHPSLSQCSEVPAVEANSTSHCLPQSTGKTSCCLHETYVSSSSQLSATTPRATLSSVTGSSALVTAPQKCSAAPVSQTDLDMEGDLSISSRHSICEKKIQSSKEYKYHQNQADTFCTTECKRCGSKFQGVHELNLHVFSLHETGKQAFCFICNQDMTGMENLEKHIHKHAYSSECQLAEMRFHDCRICGEELKSSYATIRTHYHQHHAAHACSDCYQAFPDVQAYKEHCAKHPGRPVLCSICGSKFESAQDFDQHAPCPEDIWAEDGKGDQCFKCGLWCPNRAVVEAHRKQHRSQEDVEAYRQGAKQGFPCVSCEKVFKNKHACRRHIKMVHEGVSCYKHYCEYCGKGFLTKGHMRDHIALHHLKIKRYKCDYCDRQFVCGPTLRRHVRKEHTKHKPYHCQHCGERFFEKTPLQRHLTQHTGLAPFMCEHCGKGFYTKHSFTNHGSTHSTVKEFVCSGCQKGFTRKYNLQAHTKICKML